MADRISQILENANAQHEIDRLFSSVYRVSIGDVEFM